MTTFLIVWLCLGLVAFGHALYMIHDDGELFVKDLFMLVLVVAGGGLSFFLSLRYLWEDGLFHRFMNAELWKKK